MHLKRREEIKRAKRLKFLLMDDDEVVRRVARAMLEQLGHEVEEAEEGGQALKKYENALKEGRRFDAVILDIAVLQGMGGQTAITKLLEMDPDTKAIVTSGCLTDPAVSQPRDYGFEGVLVKPFRMEELAAVVDRLGDAG